MRFIFYSPVKFENWDWRNSVEQGIGGSETSHVEMAWRLARRGHEVITYAPIPDDCPGEWKNTKWYRIEEVDWSLSGTWIIYRAPSAIDNFDLTRKDQQKWLLYQDYYYQDLTPERVKAFDKHITLCKAHAYDLMRKYPDIGDRMWLTSNGLKVDLLEEVEKEGIPERNPYKMIFTSSPDRGLKYVIQSFLRAREFVPQLELHAFYGFNNLSKLPWAKSKIEELEILLKSPGVHWHGRVSQKELYQHWLTSGFWMYQTNFWETSCITCMEAQGCGAIPIFNPVYALGENVHYGVPIYGDAYEDPLTRARFVGEVIRMGTRFDIQNQIRKPMMEFARKRFDWQVMTEQWICEAEGRRADFEKQYDFPSQIEIKKKEPVLA